MASLAAGTLLNGGKYVVVKELNRGGSAVVMEAVQTTTGRRVALKASRLSLPGAGSGAGRAVLLLFGDATFSWDRRQQCGQRLSRPPPRPAPTRPRRWCSHRRSGWRVRSRRTIARWPPPLPFPALA